MTVTVLWVVDAGIWGEKKEGSRLVCSGWGVWRRHRAIHAAGSPQQAERWFWANSAQQRIRSCWNACVVHNRPTWPLTSMQPGTQR